MESQQQPPKAPPRRRAEERASDSTTSSLSLQLDGSEHPALRAQEFHRLHRSALELTAAAQNADIARRSEDAFKSYSKALQYIDNAVGVAHQGGFEESDVNRIDELTYQLRITRKQILERVADLHNTQSESDSYLSGPSGTSSMTPSLSHLSMSGVGSMGSGVVAPLPSYDEVVQSSNRAGPSTGAANSGAKVHGFNYTELVAALDDIAAEQAEMANPLPLNAHEIFTIQQNVQIYFISPDDNVSAPSYPSFLRVVVTEPNEESANAQAAATHIPAFLQVGDWTYPLVPHSPVLQTPEGLYVFPDLNSRVAGSSVGLILPPESTPEIRQTFEEILLQLLKIRRIPRLGHPEDIPSETSVVPGTESGSATSTPAVTPTDSARRFSTKLAEGLISGAETVSKGLVYGATKTSILLDKGSSYLQSKMDPVQEKPVIKPEVKKGMKVAKTVTGKAVQVSGFLVSQVGNATMALGRHLAPHVQRAGTKLLAKTTSSNDQEASKKMDQVLEVTSGAVAGFGTLYLGLESAATVLANSLANNTVQIIHHRYGDEAGELANDTAATAGSAAMTAWNVQQLGPKAMARKVAKDTGKQVVKNYKDKKSPKSPGSQSPDSSTPAFAAGSKPSIN